MKSIVTIILSLFLFLSCTNSTSATNESKTIQTQAVTTDSTENIALKYLFDKISNLPKASFQGNQILLGDNSIHLKIDVEFDGSNEGKWIYAAKFSTIYHTNQDVQIDVGSIGIGSNKEEAVAVCIQEWFAIFGVPFTSMLNGDKSLRVSKMEIFSGLMGIRGNAPENTWMKGYDKLKEKIADQIQAQIKSETADIIPIDIKLLFGKNGISDGECRIGNKVSMPLLEGLKELNWPKSDQEFLLKQFYLIKKVDK